MRFFLAALTDLLDELMAIVGKFLFDVLIVEGFIPLPHLSLVDSFRSVVFHHLHRIHTIIIHLLNNYEYNVYYQL